MNDADVKLTKQWRNWTKSAGLKSSYTTSLSRSSRKHGECYFTGHGRHWRLNCSGFMDMSEPFETFDRWANSCEKSQEMTAKNKSEFIALISGMKP